MSTPKKISEFDTLPTPTDNDLLITSSGGDSYKITRASFLGSANNVIAYEDNAVFGYNNIAYYNNSTILGRDNLVASSIATAVGNGNLAGSTFSTSIGYSNAATSEQATAIGGENTASGFNSVAIGANNTAPTQATAIGCNNIAGGDTVAIGKHNEIDAYSAIGLGNDNTASGDYSIAIGFDNDISSIGYEGAADNNIAIGNNNRVLGGEFSSDNLIIGASNISYDSENILIGNDLFADDDNNIMIGRNNSSYDDTSIVIGQNNMSYDDESIVIGNMNYADGYHAIVIGGESSATDYHAISIGGENQASNEYAIAIGVDASSSGYGAIAFGFDATASSTYSIAIGSNSYSNGNNAISIGYESYASYDDSIAIGYDTSVGGEKTTAIGYRASAQIENTINFGGMPIIRQADEINTTEYEPYAGTETVIMSEQINLMDTPNFYLRKACAYKAIPYGSRFFPDEVGFIITNSNTIAYDTTVQFGTAISGGIDPQLVQSKFTSNDNTNIVDINLDQTPALGNRLVVFIASEDYGVTSVVVNGDIALNETVTHTHSNMVISAHEIYIEGNVSTVNVAFSNVTNSRCFVFEYKDVGSSYGYAVKSINDTTSPDTEEINFSSNDLNPGSLSIAIIVNKQTDDLTTATNGFTIIDQGDFGTFHAAVLTKSIAGTNVLATGATSPNSADSATVMLTFRANITSANDLVDDYIIDAIPQFGRERMLELTHGNGSTLLWAAVTQTPSLAEEGYAYARFYWKGLLIENQ